MDQPAPTAAGALLITGTVGSGKTSVAEAIGDLLAQVRIAHAVIDVDGLRRAWPNPPNDPFNSALTLRNIPAVAHNYLEAGTLRLVLADVVETQLAASVRLLVTPHHRRISAGVPGSLR